MSPTPEQVEHAVMTNLIIATTAAQTAAGIAMVLHQQGLLSDAHAQHFAMLTRHLGETFQAHGDDDMASDFGAMAATLMKPRTSGA